MYSKTVNGHTFLARAANHSTKGSRRGFELLDHGENAAAVLTPEEQRHSLVRRVQQIDLQLQSMGKKDLRRPALGKEKHALQNRINELRPKLKGGKEAGDHFVSVARERLPKALFHAIMNEASRRAAAERSEGGRS
jgi:hypothetical protein